MKARVIAAVGVVLFCFAFACPGFSQEFGATPSGSLGFLSSQSILGVQPSNGNPVTTGFVLTAGYVFGGRGVSVNYVAAGPTDGNSEDTKGNYPLQGVRLGGLASVPFGERMGLLLGATYFIPAGDQVAKIFAVFPGGATGDKTWDGKTQWWTAEAAVRYGLTSNAFLLGGFRYDNLSIALNARNIREIVASGTDTADATFVSYIPLVGLVLDYGSLLVGIQGFPYVPGTAYSQGSSNDNVNFAIVGAGRYLSWSIFNGSFTSSKFLEVFARYSTKAFGGELGLFGEWSYLEAAVRVDLEGTAFGLAPPLAPLVDLGAALVKYDASLNRSVWVIGGSWSIPFTSPL